MRAKSILYYFAIGLLIMGMFMEEVEARRKILRGRKTITRRYYRGTAIPAWSIVLMTGIGMLIIGAGFYGLLKRLVVDSVDTDSSYQPALQQEI
ncbi:uncharacterized protein hoka [Neodiprion pinetum]|uniref:Uncharacterized protein LOC107224427 n=1 Tax=Neodiprion lecontei TaxID=441921 RepID=A0A6J0C098_NEOLC|nr:uncharacterized protein LOC107224427 [Neodiprion lecontei]XP_046466446.1 uncharacterized protein LOC124211432 [Neodiprion pinetum]